MTEASDAAGPPVTSVRVGLVGYGDAGRGIHARLLDQAGLTVAAVATANPITVATIDLWLRDLTQQDPSNAP